MPAASTQSSAFTLTLNEEERTLLSSFLEHALRDKQVEVHRTDSLGYREHLHREEAILRGLIDKLRQP